MSEANLVNDSAACYGLTNGVLSYRHQLAAHECSVIDAAMAILGRYLRNPGQALSSPMAVKEYLRLAIGCESREAFGVLYLNSQNQLIAFEKHFVGTVAQAPVYPREIVQAALLHNASSVIMAHNHPSGNVTPSQADIHLTETISDALRLVDVLVIDHVIVSHGDASSMAECGLGIFWTPSASVAEAKPRRSSVARKRGRVSATPSPKPIAAVA